MSRRRKSRPLKNRIWFETFGPVEEVPCHWCGRPLTFDEATVDHEPPLALGGTWPQAVIACSGCNAKRGKVTCSIVRGERQIYGKRKRKKQRQDKQFKERIAATVHTPIAAQGERWLQSLDRKFEEWATAEGWNID